MTQAAETFDQYDTTGNREDLSDMIWNVSPFDTPLLTAMKKNKASSVKHEWQEDSLAAGGANANIEGDDNQDASAITATSRLDNQTQILKYKAVVSGTQEKGMNHAGVRSELAYQEAKFMKRIKKDWEYAAFDGGGAAGIGNAKAAGNATTAREMGSIQTYLTSNVSVGAGTGAAASGNSADAMTAGTARDLDEDLLTAVLSTCFTNGADPTILAVSPTNKGVVSGFTGGGTRYVDTDDKKLVNSIDVYVGDFHTLKVVPSRQMANEIVLGIDPEHLACSDLRPLQSYDLAKTGDNHKREMVWETTLEVCTETAHFIIADTNG